MVHPDGDAACESGGGCDGDGLFCELHCSDLMDGAYNAPEIRTHGAKLEHMPIIELHPRSKAGKLAKQLKPTARSAMGRAFPEDARYRERTTA